MKRWNKKFRWVLDSLFRRLQTAQKNRRQLFPCRLACIYHQMAKWIFRIGKKKRRKFHFGKKFFDVFTEQIVASCLSVFLITEFFKRMRSRFPYLHRCRVDFNLFIRWNYTMCALLKCYMRMEFTCIKYRHPTESNRCCWMPFRCEVKVEGYIFVFNQTLTSTSPCRYAQQLTVWWTCKTLNLNKIDRKQNTHTQALQTKTCRAQAFLRR